MYPDSKVYGANMGPIWGRHDPGGPHVGPMNFAIWGACKIQVASWVSHPGVIYRDEKDLNSKWVQMSFVISFKIYTCIYILDNEVLYAIDKSGVKHIWYSDYKKIFHGAWSFGRSAPPQGHILLTEIDLISTDFRIWTTNYNNIFICIYSSMT